MSINYKIIISVGLVVIAFIYSSVSILNFSSPDDNWMLLSNRFIEMDGFFTGSNLQKVFKTIESGQYSPLNTVYYRLIFDINGLDPYYFHLFSWILHVLNIIAVFFLCKRILNLFKIDAQYLPIIVCIIWGFHPLNIESVIWISASKIPLFTLFLLISTINLIDALILQKRRYLFLSLLFFLLSCFCKEQAFMNTVIVVYIMFYHFMKNGPVLGRTLTVGYLTAIILISVIFGIVSLKANAAHSSQLAIQSYSLIERITLIGYCLFFYLKNSFVPSGLHFHYGLPFSPGAKVWTELLKYIMFFIFLAIIIKRVITISKVSYFYMFCIIGFFAHLGLVLQIIPMTRTSAVADRYMYLPLIFLLIPVVHYVLEALKSISHTKIELARCFLAVYIIYLTFYGHYLANNWTLLNI